MCKLSTAWVACMVVLLAGACTSYGLKLEADTAKDKTEQNAALDGSIGTDFGKAFPTDRYYLSIFVDVAIDDDTQKICGVNFLENIFGKALSAVYSLDVGTVTGNPAVYVPIVAIDREGNNNCTVKTQPTNWRPRMIADYGSYIVLPTKSLVKNSTAFQLTALLDQATGLAKTLGAVSDPTVASVTTAWNTISQSDLYKGGNQLLSNFLNLSVELDAGFPTLQVNGDWNDHIHYYNIYAMELDRQSRPTNSKTKIGTLILHMQWHRTAMADARETEKSITVDSDWTPDKADVMALPPPGQSGNPTRMPVSTFLKNRNSGAENTFKNAVTTGDEEAIKLACLTIRNEFKNAGYNLLDQSIVLWLYVKDSNLVTNDKRRNCLSNKEIAGLRSIGFYDPKFSQGTATFAPTVAPATLAAAVRRYP